MFSATTFPIRLATDADIDDLRRLAERNSDDPLVGRVLIGWIDGVAAAELSVDDDRVVADSSPRTGQLVAHLRMRAAALRAYEAMPSLPERMLAGLPARYRVGAAPAPQSAVDARSAEYEPVLVAA